MTPLVSDNQGLELDEEAQMGSEDVQVEDGMEQPFETENVEEGHELDGEAEVKEEETAIESQNSENPAAGTVEADHPIAVSSQPTSTPASITNMANTASPSDVPELAPAANSQATENPASEAASTQSPVAVSSNPQEDVTTNTSIPSRQRQEPAEGLISDTETVYPEEGNLEPYVFNWADNAFIDATGHLNVHRPFQGIPEAHRPRLPHDHWIGLTEVDKPKQTITHYPGFVDSSGQQPSLPVPELTVTTPEGDTFWLDDPLPYDRLCMNRQWLSKSFVDETGHMGVWREVLDEEQREQVAKGQRRLQRNNWVLSKFPPLEKKPEGVPEITVTVPEGNTFYLDEPRSWADLDDDDDW